MKLSYHAAVERKDRLEMLEELFGFTRVVMEGVYKRKKYCITSSGILILKTLNDIVITAYPADLKIAIFISREILGKKQMSPKLYNRIVKNMEKYPHLYRKKFSFDD